MHGSNSASVKILGVLAGPHIPPSETKPQTQRVVSGEHCDKNLSRYAFNQTYSYSNSRYLEAEYYSSFLCDMHMYAQARPQLPISYQRPFGNQYVKSNLAQPHAHQNAEPARRAIFHGEGQLLVVSQQKLPYSQTVPSTPPSVSPECTRGWQAMETIRASTTTRNSDIQQRIAVYIGDHGHTPTNATLPSPSANSRPLKQDFICIPPNICYTGEPRSKLSTSSSSGNLIGSSKTLISTPTPTVLTSSSNTSSPSPVDREGFMKTPSKSVGNETQLERYDEWTRQVEKFQLTELPGLEGFKIISRVSQERIRDIRADPSGLWARLSEETIGHMVIKIKLKKRAKRKHEIFLQLQKRTSLGSKASRRISVRGTQAIGAQTRKCGIGAETVEMRETVAQMAFWEHEKAEFASFELDLLSMQRYTPRIISPDAKAQVEQQIKGPSQHQMGFEQQSETFTPANKNEGATGSGGTQSNTTKSFNISGASRDISLERRPMEQAVPGYKLQMPTSLALSRGFGGATLSQMMGVGDDEQLVKLLVSLSPETSIFDKRPEFSPGETTWETLKNMSLD